MNRNDLGALQIAIILLAAATAVIHLALGIPVPLWMFILNGIGYLVLVAALYLPQFSSYKPIIRWILIGYTAVTIIGWVVFGARNTIAYIDKVIELALIVLLVVEMRRS